MAQNSTFSSQLKRLNSRSTTIESHTSITKNIVKGDETEILRTFSKAVSYTQNQSLIRSPYCMKIDV